ncbi:hypothetical protein ARALYDRAFT_918662 [Arabidopsis lyrata subsp. lyrata]|uniref:Uncharacterized protein n=1 Tax=Arabidopsis lyrata subsp. lyrata TaxID=81972 RepID=D7MV10_ARALL|nr:hypothetical protein ARALYDRAFT_918662 [Arabidopsis lyrata subsp. lyrata]
MAKFVNNGGKGKRKRTTKKETEKKARATKTREELEYIEEKRNLEDLWKNAFPVGTEIESPFPPSEKLGIKVVQTSESRGGNRSNEADENGLGSLHSLRKLRRAALRHMKEDRVKMFEYCLPYFYNPLKEDELEQSTEVDILFPSEPPEFVDGLIEDEALPVEQKDEFNEFVKEQVRAAKKASKEAKVAREKAIEEMSEDTKEAFENMKLYKFYPRHSPDVPRFKTSSYINRYYGKAHQVL